MPGLASSSLEALGPRTHVVCARCEDGDVEPAATASDPTAIVLAVIALVVSVAALGFTGWQAVTAHLARTRPAPASFVYESSGPPSRTSVNDRLHNIGGSAASSVVLTITSARPSVNKTSTVRIAGVIAPGQAVPTGGKLALGLYVPSPDKPGHFIEAPKGSPDAVRVIEQWAKVEWTDSRGKHRKGRIALW